MPAVGELLRRLARQFAAAPVDLERLVGDVELRQRDRRAAERVGLHRVGAGLEVAAVDFAHQVGARQVQHVGAVLLAVEVAVDVQGHALHPAAHAAVAQQHSVAQRIEQMETGHGGFLGRLGSVDGREIRDVGVQQRNAARRLRRRHERCGQTVACERHDVGPPTDPEPAGTG